MLLINKGGKTPKPTATVKVEEHGSAYAVKDGELIVHPLNIDGSVDYGSEGAVEESPKKDRIVHEKVLKKLGYNQDQIKKILSRVRYY